MTPSSSTVGTVGSSARPNTTLSSQFLFIYFFRNAILIHWIIWIKAFNCIAWSSSGDQLCSALLNEQWIGE